jgi:hypothetical protein
VTDARHHTSLLVNGGFEATAESWTEFASDGYYVIVSDADLAESGTWLAWMGGTYDSTHSVHQAFDVPPNALELEVDFFYWIATEETGTAEDFGLAEIRDANGTEGSDIETLLNWASVDDETTGWERFNATYDASGIAGDTVSLYFESEQSPVQSMMAGDSCCNTNFFVDTVSATAMCCGDPCQVN